MTVKIEMLNRFRATHWNSCFSVVLQHFNGIAFCGILSARSGWEIADVINNLQKFSFLRNYALNLVKITVTITDFNFIDHQLLQEIHLLNINVQSVKQSIIQSINKSINQLFSQSVNQSIYHSFIHSHHNFIIKQQWVTAK